MRALRFTAFVLLASAASARAQTIEVTPVVGYRFGGGFTAGSSTGPQGDFAEYSVDDAASFGVHVGYTVSHEGELELLYSRQDTRASTGGLFSAIPAYDLALETWQAGGNYLFEDEDARLRPYVGMGLGITRVLPAGASSDARFSASFAAGAKVWLGRHVGLRFEGRALFTFLGSDKSTFCHTGQGCQVTAMGSGISQGDFRAGLVLRF